MKDFLPSGPGFLGMDQRGVLLCPKCDGVIRLAHRPGQPDPGSPYGSCEDCGQWYVRVDLPSLIDRAISSPN